MMPGMDEGSQGLEYEKLQRRESPTLVLQRAHPQEHPQEPRHLRLVREREREQLEEPSPPEK